VALIALTSLGLEATIARDGSATRSMPTESGPTESARRSRDQTMRQTKKLTARRLREGTLVTDQGGFFREDGDGATFVADSGIEFGALPNLNLERITRQLKSAEQPGRIRWSVTGQVTEFSERNFLLISRAVYKSAAKPPVPQRVPSDE